MKVEIRKEIGFSELDYQNYVTEAFNSYCLKISYKVFVPARVLQKDTRLFNYFLEVWRKRIEIPFVIENLDFIEAKLNDQKLMFQQFEDYVSRPHGIHENYPAAIIKSIKNSHYKKIKKDNK